MRSGKEMDDPFLALLDEIRALYLQKNADYGREGDPYANVRAAERFGVPAWKAALIRAGDKMRRLEKYASEGHLTNESAEDSMMDGAVYHLIALVLHREMQR